MMRFHTEAQISQKTGLVTLGPEGTDAHEIAKGLSQDVLLCASFREVFEITASTERLGLVACGCVDAAHDEQGRWVDLHFEFGNELEIVKTIICETKEMCVAHRKGLTHTPDSVSLYPATRVFADKHLPGVEKKYFASKPAAVAACHDGLTDACIGSVDVVADHAGLEMKEVFQPEMIWVLYRRKPSIG